MSYLQQFEDYLKATKSTRTVAAYLGDLRLFTAWFAKTNGEEMSPQAITPIDVREYRQHLLTVKRRKPATINRKLASLSAFCTWAQEAGIIESDPTKGIQGVGEVEVGPRWLHRKAQYALLRELQKAQQLAASRAGGETDHPAVRKAVRDAAVVALMLHAGLRVGELAVLTIKDITLNDRSGQVAVRGKGDKRRTVPLNADARKALKAWLEVRPSEAEGCLFIGQRGDSLSPRAIERLVARYAESAGLEGVTPHTLRHSFGKGLVDAGVSLDRVATLMGHSRLETTRIYTVPSEHDLQQAVEELSWEDE